MKDHRKHAPALQCCLSDRNHRKPSVSVSSSDRRGDDNERTEATNQPAVGDVQRCLCAPLQTPQAKPNSYEIADCYGQRVYFYPIAQTSSTYLFNLFRVYVCLTVCLYLCDLLNVSLDWSWYHGLHFAVGTFF